MFALVGDILLGLVELLFVFPVVSCKFFEKGDVDPFRTESNFSTVITVGRIEFLFSFSFSLFSEEIGYLAIF